MVRRKLEIYDCDLGISNTGTLKKQEGREQLICLKCNKNNVFNQYH